ncbi:MAG TPA: hypothetical protein VKT77_09825 [Chthonomonadaceae bacterium]|nr:hypothetical protein [Chthonomonadaceae bacterium]
MTLAVVQGTVGFVALMIATWTGLLVSVAFLLPRGVARSEQLVASEPWWCLLRGAGLGLVVLIGMWALGAGPGIVKLFGFSLTIGVGALAVIGAAGLVQMIGRRGQPEGGAATFGTVLRGSLVYSLALGFPFIGWFVFAPLSLIVAAGAGVMALVPEPSRAFYPPSMPPTGNDYDLSGSTGAIS